MRVAITGAGGMLGQALKRAFHGRHELTCWTRGQLDIEEAGEVDSKIRRGGFDWLLNAAAYTAVDKAEEERDNAFRANALGCRNLATACHASSCRLLSIGTDYIFDGEKGRPYQEWDAPRPLNVYGQSKWAGEQFIRELCPRHLIVRTSWLYGAGGEHFVDTIVRYARGVHEMDGVNDEIGSPTWTEDLARMVMRLVEEECLGTCHVTNSGHCSRYHFVREIVDRAGLKTTVNPLTSEEFGAKHFKNRTQRRALRPTYSVLDNAMLRLQGWEPLPSWQEALGAYLEGTK